MSEKKIGPAKGKTAAEALITGVAVATVLILLNVLTVGSRARLDLTEDRIYSLSPASKTLVSGMKEKVNIKGYFGNVPAEYAEKVTYVDMLLSEYADASNGKIVYERVDPWDKPDLQQELKKDGVDKLRLASMQDDSYEQVMMYFHVVLSHLDKKEVWTPGPAFAMEGLEYDFSTRIKRLGYGKKKVGITTGFGEPAQTQVLQAPGADVLGGVKVGLADLYEVQTIDWKATPKQIDDVDVLIVNGPTEPVSEAAKYQLDQAIMKGKSVLFLATGMRWQAGGGQQQIPGMEEPDQPYIGMPQPPALDDMLTAYGFKVGQDVILDARNTARGIIPPGSRGGMMARGFFPYAQSSESGEKGMLAGIDVVALPYASTLTLTGGLEPGKTDAETQVIKLLETAPTSWKRSEIVAVTPQFKLAPPENEHGPYLAAAAVAGKFKSAFAGKPAPAGVEVTEPAAESISHTRMIVVTAPAVAQDETLMDVRTHGDVVYVNGLLAVHNMVDWLAEEVDLIAVRSKKPERPIERLEPAKRSALKYANVVGAPLFLVLIGVFTWRLRERRRRNIKL